jgi:hypothetical protein
MEFYRDDYLLLSRRGSVPPQIRPGPRPETDAESRLRATSATPRRPRLRTIVHRGVRAAAALPSRVQATWAALRNEAKEL